MSRNNLYSVILIFFLFGSYCSNAQMGGPNYNELESLFNREKLYLEQKTDVEFLRTWREDVVFHLDSKNLDKNKPIFFKAYILTGPKKVRATLSKVLRLEIIDQFGNLVKTQYHRIQDGMAQGSISIPKGLSEGEYTLRSYTQWMKNYGEKNYYIAHLSYKKKRNKTNKDGVDKIERVEFFPAGGKLVSGLENWLLLKTYNKDGKPIDLEGVILDEEGSLNKPVMAYKKGISSVRFVPKYGKQYLFRSEDGRTFPLPRIADKGYIISANTLKADNLTLRVQASEEFAESQVWLTGVMNSVLYFKKELILNSFNTVIDIPKSKIPSGVLMVELTSRDGTVLAKRPVSIESEQLKLTAEIKKEKNNPNDQIYFRVVDKEGNPIETELSISVTQFSGALEDNKKQLTASLYNSETKRASLFKKDLNLLTSDENRLTKKDGELPETIEYPFQRGLNLYGYAYDLANKLLINTDIQVYGMSNDEVYAKEIRTDASGMLRLEDLQFEGETQLVFRTSGEDTQSRLVKFVPKEEKIENSDIDRTKDMVEAYGKKPAESVESTFWEPVNKERLVMLDEVSVSEQRTENRISTPSIYGITPTRVKYQDFERPQTIPQLFLGIPGVQVSGLGTFEPRVSLPKAAGLGPVLWVLDGMPLVQPTKLSDIITMVSYTDVDKIETLYGAQASIFGSRATGGAIVVYTRSGGFLDNIVRKEATIKFQGYSVAPSFEDYWNNLSNKSKKVENWNMTLYWNPSLKTNEKGEAYIKLRKPNESAAILELKATAITEQGKVGNLRVVY